MSYIEQEIYDEEFYYNQILDEEKTSLESGLVDDNDNTVIVELEKQLGIDLPMNFEAHEIYCNFIDSIIECVAKQKASKRIEREKERFCEE